MIPVKILDETSQLEAVVLGTAESFGGTPGLDETYDPKSREHILKGTFPSEENLCAEMEEVVKVFEKYDVEVYRPQLIEDYNQIFARDISFVLEEQLVVPCVTPLRKQESDGIQYIIDQVENVLLPDEDERMEGGDIIPWDGHLFVGYTRDGEFEKYEVARTNEKGLNYLRSNFSSWQIHSFELNKSDSDPMSNALHLDCCFQPVGRDKAVVYRGGFRNVEDYNFLLSFFGKENVFEISQKEMYEMNSNFFSISPQVVISDASFERLNKQLEEWEIKVEKVNYREVAKMEGLLRCTTMPLRRNYG